MRRLLWLALAAGAACSKVSPVTEGPTNTFYKPTGIGLFRQNLVVASSNADLLYDPDVGGSVITVRPDPLDASKPPRHVDGINIESFAAQMVIADDWADGPRYGHADQPCALANLPGGGPLALLAVRGVDWLYRLALDPQSGAPSCANCALGLATNGNFADAYALGLACTPDLARVYVGYLRGANATGGNAWASEVDLKTGTIRSYPWGSGQLLDFAFDAARQRVYAAQPGTGIRWIDVADCQFDADPLLGGCRTGFVKLPAGVDAHAIVLSRPDAPGASRRMYVLGKIVDVRQAAAWDQRGSDVDGVLLVTELVDDLYGQTTARLVAPPISVGYGPFALQLLPGRSGTTKRDALVALTTDDPVLLLYDDDDGTTIAIGRDLLDVTGRFATGHPWAGNQPFGLAVDPVVAGTAPARTAAVYVGSYLDGYVTRFDVNVDDLHLTQVPPYAWLSGTTFTPHRFTGGQ